jgi:hypothetical protein
MRFLMVAARTIAKRLLVLGLVVLGRLLFIRLVFRLVLLPELQFLQAGLLRVGQDLFHFDLFFSLQVFNLLLEGIDLGAIGRL